ncbi:MAG: hypothetical protein GY803_18360 [Chloroflexi bacterium]|nr:hypothetical protein [Chloroflexota bacterium]
MKWAMRIYALLLRLYPSNFYDEFGEEMTAVFAKAVRDAAKQSWLSSITFCLREIRDWPGSVLRERLRARRRKMASNGFIEKKPLPRSELLAALIIFLLPLLGVIVTTGMDLPRWMNYLSVILFGGAVTLGLAIIKGLPRWSLTYLGFVLIAGVIIGLDPRIWEWLYPYFLQSFGPKSYWPIPVRIIYSGVDQFFVFFFTLLSALILVNLLRMPPYTRAVWRRIRADWTQLSFLLYGGLVCYIIFTFDEYRYRELWASIAWICLALGAWLYLRAKRQKQRILALIGGATGAMWIVALAKWTLIPLQKWPVGYPYSPSEISRWTEPSSVMIDWVFILLMLMAPALLNLLPSSPSPNIQEDTAPA